MTAPEASDVKDVAKDHAHQAAHTAQANAADVVGHAQDATHDVVSTAADQARDVRDEAVRQARNLLGEASGQVNAQAAEQSDRLTAGLRALADELRQMAEAGSGGTATELAHQAADRAHQAAGYLDGRDPGQLLDDVRAYARRRPGAFLAGAALIGLAAGRLGRGVKDAGSDGTAPAPDQGDRPTEAAALTSPPLLDENMGLSSNRAPADLSLLSDEPLYVDAETVGVRP